MRFAIIKHWVNDAHQQITLLINDGQVSIFNGYGCAVKYSKKQKQMHSHNFATTFDSLHFHRTFNKVFVGL